METFGVIHGIWTALLIVLFVGIVVWAWSSKRTKSFDRAARAPLDDEPGNGGENQHG